MIADRPARRSFLRPSVFSLPLFVPLILLLSIAPGCGRAVVGDSRKDADEVLRSAESMFRAMKERRYAAIWTALSARSQAAIVDDTVRAIADSGDTTATPQAVRKEFETSGPLAREYWNGYLAQFDPVLALEGSRWEEVALGKERAEIRIVYARAKGPAILQLFREEGRWKVGLVETFEAR